MSTSPLSTSPLAAFLQAVAGRRPVVVAILVILICFVLMRPRRKPRPQQGGAAGSSAAAPPRRKLPAVSVSTRDVLLEFVNGSPRLKSDMLEPLFRLCVCADVYLVTQLPVDSDELEANVLSMLDAARVFGEGRCERRKAMFCCTESGRGAMCRQLDPVAHIDSSAEVVQYLAPLLQRLVYVNAAGNRLQVAKGAVQSVESLASYVAQACAQGGEWAGSG